MVLERPDQGFVLLALLARWGVFRGVCVQNVSTSASCHTVAAGDDRQSMNTRPSLVALLRRARAQFHVGLGTISPADAEEIRRRQEAPKAGQWYPAHGVVRS